MNSHGPSKKLKLNKQSLRYLTTTDLNDVLGGVGTRPPPRTKPEPPTGGISGGGGGGTTC